MTALGGLSPGISSCLVAQSGARRRLLDDRRADVSRGCGRRLVRVSIAASAFIVAGGRLGVDLLLRPARIVRLAAGGQAGQSGWQVGRDVRCS